MRISSLVLLGAGFALTTRAALFVGARLSEIAASEAERLHMGQAMSREALFVKALYDVAYLKMTSNVSVTSDEVLAEVADFARLRGFHSAEEGSNEPFIRVRGPSFSYILRAPLVDDGVTGSKTLSIAISGEGPIDGFSVGMKRSGSSKADIVPDTLAAGTSPSDSDAARLADACLVPFCQRPKILTNEQYEVFKAQHYLGLIPSTALETLRDVRRRLGRGLDSL